MRRAARPILATLAGAGALAAVRAVAGPKGLRLAAKPIPVVLLALWVARRAEPSRFRSFVVLGLAWCAVGDVVLETGRFVGGLAAFLLGHLAYLAAFLGETRAIRPLRALPFAVWGGVTLIVLHRGLGPMAVPVTLYTATICAMMWRALALVGPERPWAKSIAVGAVLFAISDTMIAVDRFHTKLGLARILILLLYWAGQVFIARGAIARRLPPSLP